MLYMVHFSGGIMHEMSSTQGQGQRTKDKDKDKQSLASYVREIEGSGRLVFMQGNKAYHSQLKGG